MNIKYATLSLLFLTSVMTTKIVREQMTKALIAAKDEELEKTFKGFEEQNGEQLFGALAEMTTKEEHMPKVLRCLKLAKDLHPEEESNVSWLVLGTIERISGATRKSAEAFANAIVSLKPSDVKLLAAIRHRILERSDARDVLIQIMAKSPGLITNSLPKWLASHGFDQKSDSYELNGFARKQAFEYLVSRANMFNLIDARVIVKKNEHYMGDSIIWCCFFKERPQTDLISKLEILILRGREKLLGDIMTFLPAVLITIVWDYLGGDLPIEAPSATTGSARSINSH